MGRPGLSHSLGKLEGPDPSALAELPREWDFIVDDLMMVHNTDNKDPALP
jgi:hypothetical protein